MRSHAFRLRDCGGAHSVAVRLASGQRVATVLLSL
jgi:hypothetical protein